MQGHDEKHFRKKSENATHNGSIILFAVDRWEENPIRLGSGEFPLPFQCANRQTHRLTDTHAHSLLNHYTAHTHTHTVFQVNHSLGNTSTNPIVYIQHPNIMTIVI